VPESSAARQRRYRARLRSGRRPLTIEIDDVEWPEILIALGRLGRDQVDDPKALARATSEYLASVKLADFFFE